MCSVRTPRRSPASFLHLAAAVLLVATSCSSLAQTQKAGYLDPQLPTEKRAEDLVSRMTLEEKISQMQNASVAIPRLGIPAYNWWNEGLHGVARSGYATVFPQAIGMAATWDTDLLHRIGTVTSTEARAKYNEAIRHDRHEIYFGLTYWSPNVNIFRDPRWGRGQETYGEDPFLTGRLAVAFVAGMQGEDPTHPRVIATPKHLAAHSGPESLRHHFNVTPSLHDLEDTYLPAFRAAITEGHADSVMCAYNAIDGIPACANKKILQDIVRDAWKFSGFVTSDCGAVDDMDSSIGHHYAPDNAHASALSVQAGTDTTCGKEYAKLTDAVKQGLISEAEIDVAVKRLFRARIQLGMFDPPQAVAYNQIPFAENDSPEHRQVALEAARKAIVLLENPQGFLPLKKQLRKIAVIGPNAAVLPTLEGNYSGQPSSPSFPLDALEAKLSGRAEIVYAQGSAHVDGLPIPAPRNLFHPEGQPEKEGLSAEYFNGTSFGSDPVVKRIDPHLEFDWSAASPAPGVDPNHFSVRWKGTITVPREGDYKFMVSYGRCDDCYDHASYRLLIDGKEASKGELTESKSWRPAANEPFPVHFADTRPHAIQIEYTHQSPNFGGGMTLNWIPSAEVLREEAVAAVRKADAVVAFMGLSPDLEGEELRIKAEGFSGGDRTTLNLPALQEQLLDAVGATGKPVVLVLLNGSAISSPWMKKAAAVIEAWYPGEEGGEAIAETLVGESNPAGRLPVTFYKSADQLPAFENYSMQGRTYRYFKGEPLYPFGYGLSFTQFQYSNLQLSTSQLQAGEPLTVEADIENTGNIAGDEVAEVYLTPPSSELNPVTALVSFERVSLLPKQKSHLRITLSPRQLSLVGADGSRNVQPGTYEIFVGGGQPKHAEGKRITFHIAGTQGLPK